MGRSMRIEPGPLWVQHVSENPSGVSPPRIHLFSPAGGCRSFLELLGEPTGQALKQRVQGVVGSAYEVTGNSTLMEADEDEAIGGRTDDAQRAADIQNALADDGVRALVLIRGGAWFTRILPLIDFSVLERRSSLVIVFGFSELTSLVNICGASAGALGVYDMGPAFLQYGLKRHATLLEGPDQLEPAREAGLSGCAARPGKWMREHLQREFDDFFRDVVEMVEGRTTSRTLTAELRSGTLSGRSDRFEATFTGGNLTVLSALVGTRFDASVRPAGRWLVIEDYNDNLGRIDRFLAHLTLAGYWDTCRGLLVGDFHWGRDDQQDAVLSLLKHHLPSNAELPILTTRQVGHVWPMVPLPLHCPMTLQRVDATQYRLVFPTGAFCHRVEGRRSKVEG